MGKKVMSLMVVISMIMVVSEVMQGANGQTEICGIPAVKFAPCLPALRPPSPQPPIKNVATQLKAVMKSAFVLLVLPLFCLVMALIRDFS